MCVYTSAAEPSDRPGQYACEYALFFLFFFLFPDHLLAISFDVAECGAVSRCECGAVSPCVPQKHGAAFGELTHSITSSLNVPLLQSNRRLQEQVAAHSPHARCLRRRYRNASAKSRVPAAEQWTFFFAEYGAVRPRGWWWWCRGAVVATVNGGVLVGGIWYPEAASD